MIASQKIHAFTTMPLSEPLYVRMHPDTITQFGNAAGAEGWTKTKIMQMVPALQKIVEDRIQDDARSMAQAKPACPHKAPIDSNSFNGLIREVQFTLEKLFQPNEIQRYVDQKWLPAAALNHRIIWLAIIVGYKS